MKPAAQLLEDGGEAVSGPEFFRSQQFFAAEGVTHTLRITSEGSEMFAPVVVRDISDDARMPSGREGAGPLRDASSPYGYPGLMTHAAEQLDPEGIDWALTGLVSLFLRHRLDVQPLAGTTHRSKVQIADPALPRKSRASDRQQIRRNTASGYRIHEIEGPHVSDAELDGFLTAYEQTMRRAGASQRYLFGGGYFGGILDFDASWLLLAVAPEGEVAAGSVVARSDGMLHYYLSGTADRFLTASPMKNVVGALLDLGERERLPVNLGGGLRPGDALEEFKRGFANRTLPFHTSEIVCDPEAYARLAAGRDARDFFPAYRGGFE